MGANAKRIHQDGKTKIAINDLGLSTLLTQNLLVLKFCPSAITKKTSQSQTVLSMRRILNLAALTASLQLSAESISFNKDVRPILSSKCLNCHGPSEKSRKADLRFDDEASALKNRDGLQAIKPGDLANSEMWHRIISEDPDEIMPPPEFKNELNENEIAILKTWIEQGARYEGHWAFVKPETPNLPKIKDAKWPRNTIDHFLLARLEKDGIQPSPEADRRTLVRRLTLDLTGLHPTLTEVDAFLSDKSPNAYEKVVDRLLASEEYAERMALIWMDASRYGDTSVFHDDGPRTMWPWRDWVLNAYKNNMPFDQFTIEQLAGDLLPEANVQQKVASGFNRNHATTDEGGAIAEEFRVEYVVDRVKTTGNIWMGMTLECAQCHDHKYDPISQEEYYRFYAFFNNNADPGMQTRRGNQAPVIDVISPTQLKIKEEAEKKIAGIQKQLEARRQDAKDDFDRWAEDQFLEASTGDETGSVEPAGLTAHLALDSFEKNLTQDNVRAKSDNRLHGKAKALASGKYGGSLKIEGNGFVEVKGFGDLEWNRPFSYGCWVRTNNGNQSGCILGKMNEGNSFRGYDLWLQNGQPGAHIIHKWQDNAVKVVGKKKVKAKEWNHIFVTYDGSGKAAGTRVYLNAEKQEQNIEADGLSGTIITPKPLRIGRRFNSSFANGVEIDDVRFYDRELTGPEVQALTGSDPIGPLLAIAPADRNAEQTKTLLNHYLGTLDEPYKKLTEERRKAEATLAATQKNKVNSMIMADNPANKMRKTYVLMRGQYNTPDKKKEIPPGTPAFLPAMGEEDSTNRLGMARWLMSKDHPLTARVTVNRYWQTLFGSGIVTTPGDFGSQGAWPSHPDLLDWLASDFRDNGWNVKRTLKQMVMSASYRQSSNFRSDLAEKDPANVLMARAPRFRILGEFVRDNALKASGLLVKNFGGPGVKPYQPPGLWNEVSLSGGRRFVADKGDKLYRRSLYTYWRRSSPQPALMAFDTPTREKCVLQRQRTNTPMQALVTLNDIQFVEAARHFAKRILKDGGENFDSRLDHAFLLTTSRPADELRKEVLRGALDEQIAIFEKHPDRAKALLEVGDSARDTALNVTRHAAWTVVASMILNLDETMNRE